MQEIHFKTEGTGAAAYIRTVENPCDDGMEVETWKDSKRYKGNEPCEARLWKRSAGG
ncbi:hypothetical protein AAH044_08025 [Phocaeicola dorei]